MSSTHLKPGSTAQAGVKDADVAVGAASDDQAGQAGQAGDGRLVQPSYLARPPPCPANKSSNIQHW